jgi:hypothetical protein
MAATLQAKIGTGSSVSWASAEGGATFNLADSLTDTTTPISVPTATGTVFSWIKNFALHVTGTGSTAITNRNVYTDIALRTGLKLHFKDVAVASYVQAASGNRPSSSGSDGATPATYTAVTTSAQLYDNTSVSTGSTGVNGDMCVMVLGVDSTYSAGAGTAITLGSSATNIKLQYDES